MSDGYAVAPLAGIRGLTPAQAAAVKARIDRDRQYYRRLYHRLADKWYFRDRDTQEAVVWSGRVEHALHWLACGWGSAGRGVAADGDVARAADWCGDGI